MENLLKPCGKCEQAIPKRNNRSWDFYSKQQFCSRKCSTDFQSQKIQVPCENCCTIVTRSPSHVREHAYCSRECRRKATSVEKPCDVCGVMVRKPVSQSNYNGFFCGHKCMGISKRKNKGQTQGRRSPEDLAWKSEVLKQGGYKCAMCGTDRKLEAHHIEPVRGVPERRHDVTNGLCVCHTCHYYGIHGGMPNFIHGRYAKKKPPTEPNG